MKRRRVYQDPEATRLEEARTAKKPWRKWEPYLSERQWGTVREDYSQDGNAWDYFTHDQARSRAYHWGEDGLAGISDDKQLPCSSVALWNGNDPILKERLFGLTNSQANHGEDVKEYYFYLDSTPTHSYMKYLYKYPQAAFPYNDLIETNRQRNRADMEYELLDTGVFSGEILFFEYFHGDNGAGLGASHQTGWTGVVARLIELFGRLNALQFLEAGKLGAFAQGESTSRDRVDYEFAASAK